MSKPSPLAKTLLNAYVDWWERTLDDTDTLEARIRAHAPRWLHGLPHAQNF